MKTVTIRWHVFRILDAAFLSVWLSVSVRLHHLPQAACCVRPVRHLCYLTATRDSTSAEITSRYSADRLERTSASFKSTSTFGYSLIDRPILQACNLYICIYNLT